MCAIPNDRSSRKLPISPPFCILRLLLFISAPVARCLEPRRFAVVEQRVLLGKIGKVFGKWENFFHPFRKQARKVPTTWIAFRPDNYDDTAVPLRDTLMKTGKVATMITVWKWCSGGERLWEFPFISLTCHLKWNGKPAPRPKSRIKRREEKTCQFPILDLGKGREWV